MPCDGIECAPCLAFQTGTQLGILYAYFMFPGGTGDPPSSSWMTWYPMLYKGMIIVPISSEHALHIHHWMVYLPLCFVCLVLSPLVGDPCDAYSTSSLILLAVAGFSAVMTFHGLVMYKDRFDIKTENPYQGTNPHEDVSFVLKSAFISSDLKF